LSAEARARQLAKLEERYYYRRIINATYFKQVKALIETRDFI